MKKSTKIVIGTLLIILLAVSSYLYFTYEEQPEYFNKIELTEENFVVNRTDVSYLDTIVSVGLDDLNISGVTVILMPITMDVSKLEVDDFELKAFTIESGDGNSYLIQIHTKSKSDMLNTLSHELIHVQQYHLDILKARKNYVIWQTDTIYVDDIPIYDFRPWEEKARQNGNVLKHKIIQILYK